VPAVAVFVLQESTMPIAKPSPPVNQLLAQLPDKTRKALLQYCETVDLEFRHVLYEQDEPYSHVHFPLCGFLSQVSMVSGHPPLEMRLIGNEGMLGGMLALGVRRELQRVVVQGPGTALRMTANQFRKTLQDHASLLRTVNRYNYTIFEQLTQTAACNRFHEVEARLAHRLLMIHDRAHNDNFHLTHQFLADMLGVLRSAVTIAAGALQQRGLIHYSRGNISIIDRLGLEASACECYVVGLRNYSKLIA
jgi:CRP-like cAMP-binding protein